ncbi:MAG: cellobiose phosphorylase [Candidatus Omnitrophica bacterium]|nr:cellobiose phosphorylase [Candidatus Omnitrophota bacterium]MDD5592575.1 cellobiose phosphorylase [Candidatus Omnitrophota bacterium]
MASCFRNKQPKYYLNPKGKEFVIENYNFAKPFANFFPGIAGKYGIPMWVFYVNRGQGIASFGTKDKDHAILEFFPANKAWQLVPLQGFRTFIKIYTGKKFTLYEPFHNGFTNSGFSLTNRMRITSSGLTLEEENLSLGLKVTVEYFTIPQDSYAALSRTVTVKNTKSKLKDIQLIDGLPQIIPYGVSNLFLKKLSRTIEAWMNIENLDKGVPFYKLDIDPADRPEVIHIEEGNFYLAFHYEGNRPKIIKPIVDPQSVFGPVTDFSCPREFLTRKNFTLPRNNLTKNKTPCAMSLLNFKLGKNSEKKFYSLIGYMRSREILNSSVPRIIKPEYLLAKKEENRKIIEDLESEITTLSSCDEFNLYARQTYLDNIMRGGYPVIFESGASESVFYLYGRKHGDLERDYNKFHIQAAYFSQGNGNYRDINQNRRCDTWFNPEIKDENVINFFNLIQADGFNPLVVKGISFTLKDREKLKTVLNAFMATEDIPGLISFLSKPFTPGDVILFIKENKIKLLPKADPPLAKADQPVADAAEKPSYDEFLNVLLSHSLKNQEAEHGEGFWTDHWTYNLDLLENYLAVYPEKLKEIIFEKKAFTFYDNTETVKPRQEKYLLKDGKIRQLHSVSPCNAKREMIKKRPLQQHLVRTQYGQGSIYQTTLINKLFCLLVNKLASLDPFGCGIEMEANKPNWFDALNGLPGLFGSSLNETLELKRLVILIKEAIEKCAIEKIYVTEEIYAFLINLGKLIQENTSVDSDEKNYKYWDKSYALKEDYRQKTRMGFSGGEVEAAVEQLITILNNALKKIGSGIEKAYDKKKNIYYAYFINEPKEWIPQGASFAKPTRFAQIKLPFFLEAQVHALKLTDNVNKARVLYRAIKKSSLYDKKLKMYKSTVSLKSMPEEIGRCRVFTPGWLEHESIWLHMEYKYMLEILKSGLYEEFYADFKNVLIPFQRPERYGRSILENSSFLVSSAFPDKNLHGNGFVARLSGSTAEFLQLWLVMNTGLEPFILNDKGELNLQFKPILACWLFNAKNKSYAFNFLSKVRVIYHNPKRKNTFGKDAAQIQRIIFNDKDGNSVEIPQGTIPSPYAQQVRAGQIKQIDIYLQ